MSEFLNKTGLTYYHNRLKTIFADKTAFETLSDKVDEIIAEGGEPNVIETVKVNGTALVPDAQKAVDIEVPMVQTTATAVQINDGAETRGIRFAETANGYTIEGLGDTAPSEKELVDKTYVDSNKASLTKSSNPAGATGEETTYTISQGSDSVSFNYTEDSGELADYVNVNLGSDLFQVATTNYVDSNGGKIDKIKVNGVEQTITNKEVDIAVPMVEFTPGDDKILISNGVNSIEIQPNGQNIDYIYNSTTTTLASKSYADATFRTEAQVQSAIDAALADITGIDFQIVDSLPAEGKKGVIYLVNEGALAGSYVEYIWLTPEGGTAYFEKIGTTDVDLTNYWNTTNLTAITTEEIDALFA